jgi:hypothetical protein
LRDAVGRLSLGLAAAIAAGVTVFAFAAGSSSVRAANDAGKPARWIALVVLLAVASAWAYERRGRAPRTSPAVLAGSAFALLALVSATWSVAPRTTAEKAASLVLLLVAAALLARAASAPAGVRQILLGLLGGAAAVAIAGLLVLAVDPGLAVEAATRDLPQRYRGFGEDANTVPLLLGIALPLAVWLTISSATRLARATGGVLVLLFVGTIAAASSRGALVAGFAGSLVVVLLVPRSGRARAWLVVAGAVLLAAAVLGATFEKPAKAPASAAPPAAGAGKPSPVPRYRDWESIQPLSFDIGPNESLGRSFLGSSGRSVAWKGALQQVGHRPLLGFGFGTESRVFVDRYAQFAGGLPENSYIGTALQLGAIGLAALVAIAALVVVPAVRSARRRPDVAACLGVFVAALVLAVVQSYIYSVGNIGTATAWICAFLAAAGARQASAGG